MSNDRYLGPPRQFKANPPAEGSRADRCEAMIAFAKRWGRLEISADFHLSPITGSDVTADYVNGLNDPVVHAHLEAARAKRQTLETVKAYVDANCCDRRAILFGVYVDRVLRGTVRLHEIGNPAGSAIMGIALFDRHVWGRNVGSSAIRAVAGFATRDLEINCICASMYADNRGSSRAFEKAGFTLDVDAARVLVGRRVDTWVFRRADTSGEVR